MPGLHPRLVRFEKSIDTKAADLAANIGGMAAKGIEVIPMASFYGRVPSTSEAQNLASWAHMYGPGGTYWKDHPGGNFALRHIEFGNETNGSYQLTAAARAARLRRRRPAYAQR